MPSDDEVRALVPGPRSITWRRSGDARVFTAAGYALVMQVAHPTVGAGVAEHSTYATDPWGRLLRTLDFTNSLIYGGPEQAAAVGRNIRAMHKQIKGVKPDGTRYHALEPAAYAWVHATLLEAIVSAHARFGHPMSPRERDRFFTEWRGLGRLLGVRDRDIPETWAEFSEYFDATVADVLEDNPTVHGVLAALHRPARPPVPLLGEAAWKAARLPAARAVRLATVGLLPPVLRERFGLRWSRAQELELRAIGAVSRSVTPLMPRSLRVMGPSYMRWRREETDRLAAAPPTLPALTATA